MLVLFLASCSYENSSSLQPFPHHQDSLASPLLSPRTLHVKDLPEHLSSKSQPITPPLQQPFPHNISENYRFICILFH
ncbi:hypothetical protein L873DRAFT_1801856, partial [Choiromyces venosus 120613-1]